MIEEGERRAKLNVGSAVEKQTDLNHQVIAVIHINCVPYYPEHSVLLKFRNFLKNYLMEAL